MKSRIDILKDIHPDKIIDSLLKKCNLSQRSFAAAISEHTQTLNAVITGQRNLTVEMALKIEQAFGYGTTLAALETDSPKNTYCINTTSQNG